jgi:hypothetical protein
MKRFVAIGMVGIFVGLGGPVAAAENETSEMYAMGQLLDQPVLPELSDKQLGSVEGMNYKQHHDCACGSGLRSVNVGQSNWMDQVNVNLGGYRNGPMDQVNEARQSNFIVVR